MASWLIIRRRHVLEGFGRTTCGSLCQIMIPCASCSQPVVSAKFLHIFLFLFSFLVCVCVQWQDGPNK